MPAGMLQVPRLPLAGGVCLDVYHDDQNTLRESEGKLQKKAMREITKKRDSHGGLRRDDRQNFSSLFFHQLFKKVFQVRNFVGFGESPAKTVL
jgi:hypothetical protein